MNEVSFDFPAIGTSWHIVFSCSSSADAEAMADKVKTEIIDRIAIFDQHYSRFREDSLVSEIAHRAGTYELPADAEKMMSLYKNLYDISHGKVTPLIGDVLVAAGYDKDYSLTPQTSISTAPIWEDVITYQVPVLTTQKPVWLDFGALGKGYLVDIVADILKSHDIHDYLINAGGDMAQSTTEDNAAQIGLEDPADPTKIISVADLKNCCIAGSSGNRRAWGSFHHIIDPDSITSPMHIAALWVVADSTILADGLATALFFMTPEDLLQHFTFEYLIIHADRSATISKRFPAVLY